MEDALEKAIREINQAYTSGEFLKRQDLVNILKSYYKGHTIELLELLESQHSVLDLLRGEGTD